MAILDLGLLIGLLAIALAIFFGLWQFRKSISGDLSSIKEHTKLIGDVKDRVIAIQTTTEKAWDLISLSHGKGQTVERTLEKLSKVKITAEPGEKETIYLIELEKPVIVEGLIAKLSKETGLSDKEIEMFGQEPTVSTLSQTRVRMHVPSTEPKLCTEYVTLFLKWLDSTYFDWLDKVKDFEEPILA